MGESYDGRQGLLDDTLESDDSFLREVLRDEPPAHLPAPGDRLGGQEGHRFEILEWLGEGGMGAVFRAHDEKLQRVVALKFLLFFRGLEEGILREARAIARLNHENIIHIFDVSEWCASPGEPPIPFLVMEYLSGESLATMLQREGHLAVPRALEIVEGIAAGLAHAHEHHVIHRDLKPSNVFLTRRGVVKLLDFGLSNLPGANTSRKVHLLTEGTPAYMAPEQWRNGPRDARTDLWAVGMVLYEMLTGTPPLSLQRLAEFRDRVMSAEPLPLVRAHNPDVPSELETLVATLLAKDPARRLASAHELCDEVRELKRRLTPEPAALRSCSPERRQVTLVACQLTGLSVLPEPLDSEDMGELDLAFHRTCEELIGHHGGSPTWYLAGEVLGCFGCSQVQEDDADRAVHAGLLLARELPVALQRRLPHLPLSGLSVRVGIFTDLLSLCVHPPDSRGGRITLQGESSRAVSWLAHQAGPGEVVLGDESWKLVRGAYATEALGPRVFEGMSGPRSLDVHRVRCEREAPSRFERTLAVGGLSRMVGRQRELRLLLEDWERARRGRGAFVLLSGEAGIGKSRLFQELSERVATEPVHLLRFQCWSQFSTAIRHPATALIQHLLHLSSKDPPEQQLRRIQEHLGRLGLSETHVQLIAQLLSLPVRASDPVHRLSLEWRQEKTIEVLMALVLELARERPVLAIVEDLHWATASQLRFLELLLEEVREQPVLVIVSSRPDFQPAWSPHPWLHTMALNRLTAELAADLVREASHGHELPAEAVRELVRKTDGVPLFIEEMTRMVLERASAGASPGHSLRSIPVTLHELLLARLDTLPSRLKALVQLCSVVGRDFSLTLLEPLTRRDETTLRRELAGLVKAGLLQEPPREDAPVYQFRHALIQDAAYQSLSRSTRRKHHQHIASVLEERFPELVEARPELLAHHHTEAGDLELAIQAWQLAGERASRRSDNQEALTYFHLALKLLPGLPDAAQRERKELHLLMDMGTPMSQVRRYNSPELEQLYERVRELLREMGDELPRLRLPFWGFTTYYLIRGRFEVVVELVQRYLALEQRQHAGTPTHKSLGLKMALCRCLSVMGDNRGGRRLVEEVLAEPDIEVAQRRAMASRNWTDSRVSAFVHGSLLSAVGCQPDESRRYEQEAMSLAEKIGQPYGLASVLCACTLVSQLRREGREASRWAEECAALCREHRFRLWLAWVMALRGWALAELGQPEAALVHMKMVLPHWHGSGIRVYMPHCYAMLAEIHLKLEQPEEGLAAVRAALKRVAVSGERFYEAELHRLRGECLRRLGMAEQARACFSKALSVAREQEAHLFELRATVSLCRLLPDLGRKGAASRILAAVYRRFARHRDSPDLREARALLEELAEDGLPRASGDAEVLTFHA
ncbi:protein kinase domain-containing protein [Pyxidicoccus sp. MSG2]|uniref:protein kinase domain-containing protein n=1 Tax=Pyxidicoccus sp. MSG2 TaxID=2996790 RepID=UPI002271AFAA|nr:protein kinase [Pyxidicoccus sp. MSG2]MCY1022500.1 protein kinase [Pyxidicoccus sp. MSG2]